MLIDMLRLIRMNGDELPQTPGLLWRIGRPMLLVGLPLLVLIILLPVLLVLAVMQVVLFVLALFSMLPTTLFFVATAMLMVFIAYAFPHTHDLEKRKRNNHG